MPARAPLLAALAAVGVLSDPAAAQSQVDSLQPDRPDVSNGTHIVGVGLVQIEIGGLYTYDGPNQGAFGSPFTARLGLVDWLELRIGGDGLLVQSDTGTRETGFGNMQFGAKLRLWAKPGGAPVLSIVPSVNVPTADAAKGLGSGDADYTVVALTGTDLGSRAHVDVNYGIGSIGAGGGNPHFVQHLVSVSASVTATAKWNPYLEGFWFSRQVPDAGPVTAVDGGAIYAVGPRLALDGGIQVGLSDAAPAFGVFAGASIVVGDIFGGHGVHGRQRRGPSRTPKTPPARR